MRSTRPVCLSAVLYTVDQNDLVIFEELIDDAIVATPRRPQSLERIVEPTWDVSDRPGDRLERSVAHIIR